MLTRLSICTCMCVCVCVCCSFHKQIMDMTTATIEEQSEAVQEFYNVSLCVINLSYYCNSKI